MSLLQKYKSTKELISGRSLSIPLWDLLIIMDMAERAPTLEAEARYLESLGSNIDQVTAKCVTDALSVMEKEQDNQKSQQEENGRLAGQANMGQPAISDPQTPNPADHANGKGRVKSQAM